MGKTLIVAAVAAVSAAAAIFTPATGHAQELAQATQLAPPIKPEDIAFYCIYANRVYSVGSQLCVDVIRIGTPAQAALLCKPPTQAGQKATWDVAGSITCTAQPAR